MICGRWPAATPATLALSSRLCRNCCHNLAGSIGLLPLVGGNGLVVVAQPDGLIQTVNWDNGDVEWETSLGAEIVTPLVIYQDDEIALVLVATHEGALYALDLYDAGWSGASPLTTRTKRRLPVWW